jgi:hypothetical protein
MAGGVKAATISDTHIGNWLVGAYSDDKTGAFSHCAASVQYNSGILMLLAIDRSYQWSMGFATSNWHLTVGHEYPISFTVDNTQALDGTGVAVRTDMVRVPLADSAALFNQFRRGYMLRVYSADQKFEFVLSGTNKILPALLRCVKSELERSSGPETGLHTPSGGFQRFEPDGGDAGTRTDLARNDTRPQDSLGDARKYAPGDKTHTDGGTDIAHNDAPTKTPPATSPVRQAEATTFLANVLRKADVPDYTMLSPQEAESLSADAAWKTDKESGTLNVYEPSSNIGPDEIAASLLQKDGRACGGKFISGTKSEDKENKGTQIFTSCTTNNQTVTAQYSIVPRPGGGYYVLGTLGADDSQSSPDGTPVRNLNADIRTAAYKLIVK